MTTQEPKKRTRKTPEEMRAILQAQLAEIDNGEARRTKKAIEAMVASLAPLIAKSAAKPYLPQLQQAVGQLTTASAQIKVVEVQ